MAKSVLVKILETPIKIPKKGSDTTKSNPGKKNPARPK